MNFISFEFFVLFIATFTLLTLIKSISGRKLILLAASFIFYAYWDWRFLGLLIFMTIVIYYLTQLLIKYKDKHTRKVILIISIVFSLSFLMFFKYFNFFIESFNIALIPFGLKLSGLNIILPIGISFYTFEILSYVIDVFRNDTTLAKSLLDFTIFITYFPRLISGPIIRAKYFFPQLERGIQINLSNFTQGSQLILIGLIKKLVVADSLAAIVDKIYSFPSIFSPATIWLGIFAYSVQVFCDFSGYIDIARGISKIMGFDLPINFNLPYTAQSPTEFWRRWNITLSNWFRDYVFLPLELKRRKVKNFRLQSNLMIVFLLIGLWHGASWNFVFWGGLHGGFLIVERWITRGRPVPTKWKAPKSWLRASITYMLVVFSMVFFRSPSLMITGIVLKKLFFLAPGGINWLYTPALILFPLIIFGGWIYRSLEGKIRLLPLNYPIQFSVMALEVMIIYFFASLTISPFIYFQF
jgi:alginate O-acetyltransferase complex protein AlgI